MFIVKGIKKGQVLVAMVVLILLSLSLGISISGGFITNLRVQTQADDLSKAQSAAEALVEKILLIPTNLLEEYIDDNSCGSSCTWAVTDTTGQIISATATLTYSGNSTDKYDADLETTSITQINLRDYPSGEQVDVCWNSPASIYASYLKKDGSDVITSEAYAYNSVDTPYPDNGLSNEVTSITRPGFDSCFPITVTEDPLVLRLKSYYLNTVVSIFPEDGQTLPKQGVLITVLGRSGTATKKVAVLKTTGAVSGMFDYAILQKSPTVPLSNVTL